MSIIRLLALKEIRLLLRDRMAALVLLVLPLLFILVLGLLLGEGFGQKPDDRLRFSLVDLDVGVAPYAATGAAGVAASPCGDGPLLAATLLIAGDELFPGEPWSKVLIRDLSATPGLKAETIPDEAEARRPVAAHQRPTV